MKRYNSVLSGDTITVLLAEDRKMIREAWSFILKNDSRFRIIAECTSPEVALLQARDLCPDIVIMEIKPPDLGGIELVSLVQKFSPGSKILCLSLYTFPSIANDVMKAGASGYLTKTSPLEEMLQALERIKEGENYLCREIKKTPRERPQDTNDRQEILRQLSIREIEVVAGIKNGMASWKIAEHLDVTSLTVEMHIDRILKKLGLYESSELVALLN